MSQPRSTGRSGERLRCEYCGYQIPDEVHRSEDGHGFCSRYCLEAFDEEEPVPAEDAYHRFETGIEPLDALVPAGLPADAFVLFRGEDGTRRAELLTELVWRALEREQPAVYVAGGDPPTAVLERFFTLGWNPLPALEDGRLRILDCFTHRLEEREAFDDALNGWNRFLADAADDAVETVHDPGDVPEVTSALYRALEDLGMTESGLVALDSLEHLATAAGDGSLQDLLTDVRATVARARFVPVVAGARVADGSASPVAGHAVDGLVDCRLTGDLVAEMRLKQLSVRKLVGTSFDPRWISYEVTPGRGTFSFDPATETGSVYETPAERVSPRPDGNPW